MKLLTVLLLTLPIYACAPDNGGQPADEAGNTKEHAGEPAKTKEHAGEPAATKP